MNDWNFIGNKYFAGVNRKAIACEILDRHINIYFNEEYNYINIYN